MDASYTSVEQRDTPALRGQPVAVGGRPEGRGVVAAASYEARTFGVHSAMSMAKAVRLCPSLVILRPDFTRYRQISRQVFDMYRSVTSLVKPLSLDEAYLDVTENAWGEPLATNVARRLKHWIREETGLTVSAGAAPNKFLAKIASDWDKPDGLTIIPTERVEAFLQRLPVEALWGVGPVTARRLRAAGVSRLVDVRTVDLRVLRDSVGSQAGWLRRLANGIDDRPVTPNRTVKSSGSENTYPEDLTDSTRSAPSWTGWRAAAPTGWHGGRCSPKRSPSRCATRTSPPSPAATANDRPRATPTRSPHARRCCSTAPRPGPGPSACSG